MKYSIIITFIIAVVQVLMVYLDLHHYNAYLDRFIWDTVDFFVPFFIFLLLLFFFRRIKKPLFKYIYLTFPVLVGMVCFLMFTKGCVRVSESNQDYTQKMYFHSDDNWKYYARTWRRSALDRLNIFVRKEKAIGIGFYVDKRVDNVELKGLGFDELTISERYQKFYFRSKE